jgi:hypothetical protein
MHTGSCRLSSLILVCTVFRGCAENPRCLVTNDDGGSRGEGVDMVRGLQVGVDQTC